MAWNIYQGKCEEVLQDFDDSVFDAIVTDPPYELGFMGQKWDATGIANDPDMWVECLRVLKPGGHLLAFGGTRTYHRMTCAIEDAGFEIRDTLEWIYGSGFPKGLDVSKAIDKSAGAERKEWEGWNVALKPAHEPIVLARKPLEKGLTVAQNVLKWGTGAINVDACRVAGIPPVVPQPYFGSPTGRIYGMKTGTGRNGGMSQGAKGRWPPNVLLSHSEDCRKGRCSPDCPVAELDRQSGNVLGSHNQRPTDTGDTSSFGGGVKNGTGFCDSGGASRFFPVFRYQAKAPRSERPEITGVKSHSTVKPLSLMRWLVRLITPPGGCVLDQFGGTGTTAEACELERFNCTLIERDANSVRLTRKRMRNYRSRI